MQHPYFPFGCRIISWCFTRQWFKLADLLFLHFSSWVVSLLKSWSELIGFCNAWSVHIRFVCVTVSDVLVGGNNVFCTRFWCCREHSLGNLLHALDATLALRTFSTELTTLLTLCFECVLPNLPYTILMLRCEIFSTELVTRSAVFWTSSTELATRSWCYALNILWGTCHTLLMLHFEFSLGNCKPNPRLMAYAFCQAMAMAMAICAKAKICWSNWQKTICWRIRLKRVAPK